MDTVEKTAKGNGDLVSDEDVQVVEWEDYEDALARFCGASAFLKQTRAKRDALAQNVREAVEASSKARERANELALMDRKLLLKEEHLHKTESEVADASQQLASGRQKLSHSGNSLLHAAKCLGAAQSRLKDVGKLLSGEEGYGRVKYLRSAVTARRRSMVAQVAALYPLVPCASNRFKCPTYAHPANLPGDCVDSLPMTISGLHVIPPSTRREQGLFYDKREYETSATALGYVAHATSLLARYLDVPLRYPVKFQASRSYMQDFSPAIEPAPKTGGALVLPAFEDQVAEFPLFSDGQDPTRAAYAVFLLNKDLEQILHHLGQTSVGPRHVLQNLHRIYRTILQDTAS